MTDEILSNSNASTTNSQVLSLFKNYSVLQELRDIMTPKYSLLSLAASFAMLGLATSKRVVSSKYNNPTAGPPGNIFAATTTIPVAALASAAAKATKVPKSATYPINNGPHSPEATIHSDWVNLPKVGLRSPLGGQTMYSLFCIGCCLCLRF